MGEYIENDNKILEMTHHFESGSLGGILLGVIEALDESVIKFEILEIFTLGKNFTQST